MSGIESLLTGLSLNDSLLGCQHSPDLVHCAIPRRLLVELLASGALQAGQLNCLDSASAQTLRGCVLESCCAQG